jgi:hypothetical protein
MGRVHDGIDDRLRAFIEAQQTQLADWAARKANDGLTAYQRALSATSIDGLPALRWVAGEPPSDRR